MTAGMISAGTDTYSRGHNTVPSVILKKSNSGIIFRWDCGLESVFLARLTPLPKGCIFFALPWEIPRGLPGHFVFLTSISSRSCLAVLCYLFHVQCHYRTSSLAMGRTPARQKDDERHGDSGTCSSRSPIECQLIKGGLMG